MEDFKIVQLFWDRNETAIQEISLKYGKLCFFIANNILFNREDAEECVNDTWLQAWRSIPPKKPNPLSVFLSRITRNLAIDIYRKRNAGKRMNNHFMDICGEIEEFGFPQEDYAEQYAKREEILQRLNVFLDSLSERDRDIFVRRYWFIDPIRTIARRHGCTENKIKSILFRSRLKLKSYMEDTEYGS